MGYFSGVFKQKGQALAEVLVGLAILTISIVAVTNFIVNQQTQNVTVTGSASCRNYTESILSDFSNTGSTVINNYIPLPVGAPLPNPYAVTPRVLQPYYGTSTPPFVALVNGQVGEFGNFQNIENAMTRAYQIYSGDHTYCSLSLGKTILSGVLSDPNILNAITAANYKAMIKIVPWNMVTNAAEPNCGTMPWDIRPLSSSVTNAGNIGLLITATVISNSDAATQCTGSKLVAYTSDQSKPTLTAVIAPVPAYPSTCSAAGTGTIYTLLRNSEPGSLFLCSWDAAVTNTSPACQSMPNSVGLTHTMVQTNPGPNNGTTFASTDVSLQLSGIPQAPVVFNHTLNVMGIDTASNKSVSNVAIPIYCPCAISTGCTGTTFSTTASNCSAPPDLTPGWVQTSLGPPPSWSLPATSTSCTDPLTGNCTGNYYCPGGTQTCNLTAPVNSYWQVNGSNPGTCGCSSSAVSWFIGTAQQCTFCRGGATPGINPTLCVPPGNTGGCTATATTQTCLVDGSAWDVCVATACSSGCGVSAGNCVLLPINGSCNSPPSGSTILVAAPNGATGCAYGSFANLSGAGTAASPWIWQCLGSGLGHTDDLTCSGYGPSGVCDSFSVSYGGPGCSSPSSDPPVSVRNLTLYPAANQAALNTKLSAWVTSGFITAAQKTNVQNAFTTPSTSLSCSTVPSGSGVDAVMTCSGTEGSMQLESSRAIDSTTSCGGPNRVAYDQLMVSLSSCTGPTNACSLFAGMAPPPALQMFSTDGQSSVTVPNWPTSGPYTIDSTYQADWDDWGTPFACLNAVPTVVDNTTGGFYTTSMLSIKSNPPCIGSTGSDSISGALPPISFNAVAGHSYTLTAPWRVHYRPPFLASGSWATTETCTGPTGCYWHFIGTNSSSAKLSEYRLEPKDHDRYLAEMLKRFPQILTGQAKENTRVRVSALSQLLSCLLGEQSAMASFPCSGSFPSDVSSTPITAYSPSGATIPLTGDTESPIWLGLANYHYAVSPPEVTSCPAANEEMVFQNRESCGPTPFTQFNHYQCVCGTPINGICGGASSYPTTGSPSQDFACYQGTMTSVTGTDPYSWQCVGANSGAAASCSTRSSGVQCISPLFSENCLGGGHGGGCDVPAYNNADAWLSTQFQALGVPDYHTTYPVEYGSMGAQYNTNINTCSSVGTGPNTTVVYNLGGTLVSYGTHWIGNADGAPGTCTEVISLKISGTLACPPVVGPPPAPPQPPDYTSNRLGCDWGTDSWFEYTSSTTGILHFQSASSCYETIYRQTPYTWNGSAWVPSGPPSQTGGQRRGICMAPC